MKHRDLYIGIWDELSAEKAMVFLVGLGSREEVD